MSDEQDRDENGGRGALVAEYVLGLLGPEEHERIGRMIEADPALQPQRFLELVQREAQERGSKMTKPEDVDPLLEEVNACESKYGQPLTTRN